MPEEILVARGLLLPERAEQLAIGHKRQQKCLLLDVVGDEGHSDEAVVFEDLQPFGSLSEPLSRIVDSELWTTALAAAIGSSPMH